MELGDFGLFLGYLWVFCVLDGVSEVFGLLLGFCVCFGWFM